MRLASARSAARRHGWLLPVTALALLVGLALLVWRGGGGDDRERVIDPDGLGVAVTVPASWSEVEATEVHDHPFSDLVEEAIAAPDGRGQILTSRLFFGLDLDAGARVLRGWVEDEGARVLEEQTLTLDGRDARLVRYELPHDGGRPHLHLAYLIDLDDATQAWIDVGGLPADDEASSQTLDRIGGTLSLQPAAVGARVETLTMADDGLVGEFWTPRSQDGRRPGVLLLGGSAGGVPHGGGPLALAGYPTLALAYHGEEGLPDALVEIPLEGFREGLEWLAARPEVDPERLVVWGTSRGGEAALLVASTFPDAVAGVVANVPADRTYPGQPDGSRAAWTLEGEPIARRTEQGEILSLRAPIEVERIVAPLLLTCGEQDATWPSCPMSRRIVERLEERGHPHPVTLQAYEDAGHDAILPPAQVPADVREAGNQGWRDALRFLDGL